MPHTDAIGTLALCPWGWTRDPHGTGNPPAPKTAIPLGGHLF